MKSFFFSAEVVTGLHILIVFEAAQPMRCLISPYVHIHDEQKVVYWSGVWCGGAFGGGVGV